jgi:TMEM199 family protein
MVESNNPVSLRPFKFFLPMADDLNISLTDNLYAHLQPLPAWVAPSLANQLSPFLTTPSPPTIPYSILSSISRWSRSSSFPPSLESKDYTMVTLLAGTTTSPERHFPAYIPKVDVEEARRARDDRKAITALLNGLLSIGGAGVATWWIAEGRGWKDEWVGVLNIQASGY